ncbi:MAG: hypothetical protein ACD_52C00161G0006 [uncultured bacterium]|uniref:ROK family protein n=1 Tax=Candidatus Woesebacteria bacterium RIFCSPHIGHO2_12_FULL_41_24 TaxID=1802510 RepID=A0A1F8AVX3_9BACT|nr:MAG: hypothetical protein ACD_52C00161G0006 [uncultured bacterium]OGM14403.1 MAG: hypothetical protein A2W15_02530 [Candidatus Woesebacteria bacterium RBG_16_41_13]OGM28621.1 MAG: hypothetical protein A2873_05805 [Candidatus Woesebacteria bacterium RIFCSPHIGHO2_01_FULL_42_80]OGM34158.1 MAG: hypothetical protein A3D84_04070 [Candidatus Woesebacteria bacterium RIFCSPHIGHO2_02_FULL_42_20]OGM55385.1 MAG: hypothetical protein A3E44_03825 [Candidatus Woesebacteria bacterium RIFCSPHIGHO2_12_FULL_41
MYIGIDVGGTNIKIASFDGLSNPKIVEFEKFDVNNDYKLDLKNILHTVDKLSSEELKGVGIGIPGTLEDENKEVVICPNLLDWNGRKIVHDLENEFTCPVKAENDTTLAAIGEATYGGGRDQEFVFFIWGTAIGGTEIKLSGGKLVVDRFEPGHQIVEGGKELEAIVGGAGIKRNFGKGAEDLEEENWNKILPVMAKGITNVLVVRPTKLVIFGGGVALNKSEKVYRLRSLLKDYLKIYPVPKFKISSLGEHAALFGALTLFE